MEITLKAGKKCSICSCGLSNTLPYCDNSHREFNDKNGTEYKSLKVTPYKDTIIEAQSSRWIATRKDK